MYNMSQNLDGAQCDIVSLAVHLLRPVFAFRYSGVKYLQADYTRFVACSLRQVSLKTIPHPQLKCIKRMIQSESQVNAMLHVCCIIN